MEESLFLGGNMDVVVLDDVDEALVLDFDDFQLFLEGLDFGLALLDPCGAIPAGGGLHEGDHVLQL